MGRSEEFHMARIAPGYYKGSGYAIEKIDPREAGQRGRPWWNIHYPGHDGEHSQFADDSVDTYGTAKQWVREHWETNRNKSDES